MQVTAVLQCIVLLENISFHIIIGRMHWERDASAGDGGQAAPVLPQLHQLVLPVLDDIFLGGHFI